MLFSLGQQVVTRGVSSLMKEDPKFRKFVSESFKKHCDGDWGDLGKEDKQMNENALKRGDDRLLSKYNYNDDVSIYIITEWDRSVTTILFPSEY